MIFAELFLTLFLIGMFTIGGGYAMLSLIQNEIVVRHGWLTGSEFADIVAISQITPGPIAINAATFVGCKQAGILGAVIATFGMVLPSFVIILAIASLLDHFLEIVWIANAFRGIKIAVGFLILDAGFTMIKKMPKKKLPRTIMICAFAVMFAVNLFAIRFSSIALMLIAAAVSLALELTKGKKPGKGGAQA